MCIDCRNDGIGRRDLMKFGAAAAVALAAGGLPLAARGAEGAPTSLSPQEADRLFNDQAFVPRWVRINAADVFALSAEMKGFIPLLKAFNGRATRIATRSGWMIE